MGKVMLIYLKIKIKALAAEAQIIKLDEQKRYGDLRESLHNHRVNIVRKEARASLLAYGFLRGREYKTIEGFTHTGFSWKRVEDLVKRFAVGDQREILQKFAEWKDAAIAHIELNKEPVVVTD